MKEQRQPSKAKGKNKVALPAVTVDCVELSLHSL